MGVSTETMKEFLEKHGTPPKYRSRYLWLAEALLRWRYSHKLGAWDTGSRFLPANIALRALRTHEGMEDVIRAMVDHDWSMMMLTFRRKKDHSLCYQVEFTDVVGSGGVVLATTMIDAVLLAAWRAHWGMVKGGAHG